MHRVRATAIWECRVTVVSDVRTSRNGKDFVGLSPGVVLRHVGVRRQPDSLWTDFVECPKTNFPDHSGRVWATKRINRMLSGLRSTPWREPPSENLCDQGS